MSHTGNIIDHFKYMFKSEIKTEIVDNMVHFYSEFEDREPHEVSELSDYTINALEEIEMEFKYEVDEDNLCESEFETVYVIENEKESYTLEDVLNSRMTFMKVYITNVEMEEDDEEENE